MQLDDIVCECCNSPMHTDFCNNVFCENKDCLLYGKCFSYDYYKGRAEARKRGERVQRKERLRQGHVGEFD